MRYAALIGAFFLLSSAFVFAATTGLPKGAVKAICSGVKTVQGSTIDNKNFCGDDRVSTNVLGQSVDQITCICRTQEELAAVGCAKGERQPIVTVALPKRLSGCLTDEVVISKCVDDPKAAYEAACKTSTGTLPATPFGDGTIEKTPWTAQDLLTAAIPDNKTALTNIGMSSDDADKLLAENKQGAADLIKAYASGDSTAVTKAAEKNNIPINADISDTQTLPMTQPDTAAPAASNEEPDASAGKTGFTQASASSMQCGVPDIAGGMMSAESACNANVGDPNSPNVRGPHQFMCPTWNDYVMKTNHSDWQCSCTDGGTYNGTCDAVMDPVKTSQTVNERYAQYEQQYGQTCAEAGRTWAQCSYAIHVFGEGGFRTTMASLTANPNAPAWSLCGTALSQAACTGNASIFNNGGTVAGVFDELGKRVSGGTGSTFAPTNKGYFASEAGSPLNVLNGDIPQAQPAESPMAAANPFASLAQYLSLSQLLQKLGNQQQAPIQQQPATPQQRPAPTITPVNNTASSTSALQQPTL